MSPHNIDIEHTSVVRQNDTQVYHRKKHALDVPQEHISIRMQSDYYLHEIEAYSQLIPVMEPHRNVSP